MDRKENWIFLVHLMHDKEDIVNFIEIQVKFIFDCRHKKCPWLLLLIVFVHALNL